MPRTRLVSISPRLAAAIRDHALRTGRDVSACVERAWVAARVRLASLPPPAPLAQGFEILPVIPDVEYSDPAAERLYAERFASDHVTPLSLTLPSQVLEDMIDESFRLARSLGWLIERSWCVALDAGADGWMPLEIALGDTAPMARFD